MSVLPPSFLFRFTTPVRPHRPAQKLSWNDWDRLTVLAPPSALDGKPLLHVRMGWNDEALIVGVEVRGKSSPLPARRKKDGPVDGVVLCVDTRDTKTIRRAGRFCHRFRASAFRVKSAIKAEIEQEVVPRAREDARVTPYEGRILARDAESGFDLLATIPSGNLNGYHPAESPRLGFFAMLDDSELGQVPWSGDNRLPSDADPSLWASVELMAVED